nr:hypothetical protein Iba_chr07bCG15330 [Ipomoea batatas]
MKSHVVLKAISLSASSTLTERECNKTHKPQLKPLVSFVLPRQNICKNNKESEFRIKSTIYHPLTSDPISTRNLFATDLVISQNAVFSTTRNFFFVC